LREPGRKTAKIHYGCRGFVAHHVTDIWGFTPPGCDARILSLEALTEIYYMSVGRSANLLLNIPPDQRGLIPDIDAERLRTRLQSVVKLRRTGSKPRQLMSKSAGKSRRSGTPTRLPSVL
jgi:alpha-L-fucosidase